MTQATKNDVPFEFVLVSAKELNDVTADPRLESFSICTHFNHYELVKSKRIESEGKKIKVTGSKMLANIEILSADL